MLQTQPHLDLNKPRYGPDNDHQLMQSVNIHPALLLGTIRHGVRQREGMEHGLFPKLQK